jgi:hypothetical protein
MVDEHDFLFDLKVELYPNARPPSYSVHECAEWPRDHVLCLHKVIIQRLTPSGTASESDETWITASAACDLAEKYGVPMTLSYLSRLATRQPPLFQSRPLGSRRRLVRADTFVQFLRSWKRQERAEDGATDEEVAQEISRLKRERPEPRLD